MKSGAAFQAAGIAGALVLVAGTGLASARFVDYLADRAVARTAALPGIEAAAAAPAAPAVKQETVATQQPVAKPAAPVPETAAVRTAVAAEPARPASAAAVQAASASEPQPGSASGADGEATDRTFTAAIARPAPATTAQETAAPLPVIEEPAITDGASEQAAIAATELPDAAAPAEEPTRSAKVTAYVNLRSAPNDESRVLTVVPTSGTVQIVNCDGWCEVEFKGQKGFIYKSFIDG